MVRLIDADALEHCLVIGGRRHGKTIISEIIRRAIQTAPTVDAVPVVHGKWDKGTDSNWHICEECGAEVDISMGTGVWVKGVELYELKYCPYCGAKMDAERKEE